MLVRARGTHQQFDVLSHTEKQVMEYFMSTDYCDHTCAFMEVVEYCSTAIPQTIYYQAGSKGTKSRCAEISNSTLERMRVSGPRDHGSWEDVVMGWAARHGFNPNQYLTNANMNLRHCFTMPIPQAALVMDGVWSTYACPRWLRCRLRLLRCYSFVSPRMPWW